jgi:hypothetical protein
MDRPTEATLLYPSLEAPPPIIESESERIDALRSNCLKCWDYFCPPIGVLFVCFLAMVLILLVLGSFAFIAHGLYVTSTRERSGGC